MRDHSIISQCLSFVCHSCIVVGVRRDTRNEHFSMFVTSYCLQCAASLPTTIRLVIERERSLGRHVSPMLSFHLVFSCHRYTNLLIEWTDGMRKTSRVTLSLYERKMNENEWMSKWMKKKKKRNDSDKRLQPLKSLSTHRYNLWKI